MDIGEGFTSRREETEYGGDTQGLAKEWKEIGHPPPKDELSPIAQSSRPNRPKKLKVKRTGTSPRNEGRAERGQHSLKQYNHHRNNGNNPKDSNPQHQWPVITHQNSDDRRLYPETRDRHHSLTGSHAAYVDTRI
jgi:hypothetical protein